MVQAILVLQQIEENTKGNNNLGILKSNRSMGHSIITATEEQYKPKINRHKQERKLKKQRNAQNYQNGPIQHRHNSSDGPKVTGNCQKHNAFRVQTHPGPTGIQDLNITQKIIARNFEIKEGN